MEERRSKYFHSLDDVPPIQLEDGARYRFVAGEKMLWTYLEHLPGANFPLHSHSNEQIFLVLEGVQEHICGDERRVMKAGDLCVHPPNIPHGGRSLTALKGIDMFVPPREDYLALMKKHGLR